MVYVLEARDPNGASYFKMGFTKTLPDKRLRKYQLDCPLPITLAAAMEGDDGLEYNLHKKFSKFNIHSEWFNDCPGIRQLINENPVAKWDKYMLNQVRALLASNT